MSEDYDGWELDPVFVNALREAKAILAVFAVFAVYVIGVAYALGYSADVDSESVSTIWGMPHWIFWAVLLPWTVANGVTAWFTFGFMKDDPLMPPANSDAEASPDAGDGLEVEDGPGRNAATSESNRDSEDRGGQA